MKKNDQWFRENIRQVHIDFHMPEFPRDAIHNFNAQEFVSEFVRAKANVIGVFTKCHFGNAFYDNAVGHRHSGLKEDFFGEVLAEAKKHDIKVIAYYSLGTDAHAVLNNPDWYQVDEFGKVRGSEGTVWELPCLNSPYREELVIPQVKEITEKYEMDGYLFDIPYLHNHYCFCNYCKKKFYEEHGQELTPELLKTNRELVVGFGIDTAARCMKEIYDVIRKIRPEVLVNCNGAWRMGEPASVNATSNYGLWESQPSATGSFLGHSIRARHIRTLDVPVQIMTVRFTEGWGLMSCKTAEQLKFEFACIMANGGIINIGDQVLPNGTLQSGVYDIIGEAFSFVEEREAFCIGAKSVRGIAVIADNTNNWYHDKDDAATFGSAKMLIEGHHQFDLYYNNDFPDLTGYRAVVLPENVKLSPESAERLRAFVQGGGLLLAEGSATYSREAKNFALADVLGLDYLERTPYSFAYLTEREELWKGVARIPQLVEGEFIKTVPTTAETLSLIQWPLTVPAVNRAFRHPMPPAGLVSDFPAISANRYGQGTALYIAAPVFRTYWNSNHFWVRRIVTNLLDQYDTGKTFETDAPVHVEANLMEKDGKKFLHLINFQNIHAGEKSSSFYDPIESITPVHDIEVRINDPLIRSATTRPDGLKLETVATERGIRFTVPKVHIHTIVELSDNE
ncbi:alpha-L-fucosidase [Cohnella sp. LGH]|uniref:alpha-L-fucosidase n=1 Tax=Cohnella sp. LGH TaxID=1619153 RepID=UPI001ADC6234|nr:alpha-L-fucosidase [Cohnella sp. LGH]QTH44200.1 alpha-L-fucosidase [Cohnella sp. LGH]